MGGHLEEPAMCLHSIRSPTVGNFASGDAGTIDSCAKDGEARGVWIYRTIYHDLLHAQSTKTNNSAIWSPDKPCNFQISLRGLLRPFGAHL